MQVFVGILGGDGQGRGMALNLSLRSTYTGAKLRIHWVPFLTPATGILIAWILLSVGALRERADWYLTRRGKYIKLKVVLDMCVVLIEDINKRDIHEK